MLGEGSFYQGKGIFWKCWSAIRSNFPGGFAVHNIILGTFQQWGMREAQLLS